MADIREFRVEIAQSDIDELRAKLAMTRWPDRETVPDWSQGIPLDYVRELADYWAGAYDMRRVERLLNAHPQYQVTVDGVELHVLHIRSPHENARPLLMTHGWPGSVLEFLDTIEPLTDPTRHGGSQDDAFHLVIPALPGYGFSAKPTASGTDVDRIADLWHRLMGMLGYPEYHAQGGDWGAIVTTAMAMKAPTGLLGVHLNFAVAAPDALAGLGQLTPDEQSVGGLPRYQEQEAGYSTQQGTRPQTLGYALADSPVGQLAWIVEKFHAWTDWEGHPESAVPRDKMIDAVMIYWLTNSATSSSRLYWESLASALGSFPEVALASAYSQFPRELFTISERWLRTRFTDLRYYGTVKRGGHFAALEQPDLFVQEVRAAIRALSG
jgi:epoxide hydrolase